MEDQHIYLTVWVMSLEPVGLKFFCQLDQIRNQIRDMPLGCICEGVSRKDLWRQEDLGPEWAALLVLDYMPYGQYALCLAVCATWWNMLLSFVNIGPGFISLPMWTEDHQLSRKPSGLQVHNATAEASSLRD